MMAASDFFCYVFLSNREWKAIPRDILSLEENTTNTSVICLKTLLTVNWCIMFLIWQQVSLKSTSKTKKMLANNRWMNENKHQSWIHIYISSFRNVMMESEESRHWTSKCLKILSAPEVLDDSCTYWLFV